MANGNNINASLIIADRIHDAIITNTNSPNIFLSAQFAAPYWTRLFRQVKYDLRYSRQMLPILYVQGA